MPKIKISLEEQFADPRSRDTAYRLVVQNEGPTAIQVLSINPRVPDGVTISEGLNPSVVAAKEKHSRLCAELTDLTKTSLTSRSEEIQKRLTELQAQRAIMIKEEVFADHNPLVILLYRIGGLKINDVAEEAAGQGAELAADAIFPIIESLADAKRAMVFLSGDGTAAAIREVFEFKIEQLARLESELGQDVAAAALATVEPESFYADTYVLKFQRGAMVPRKYNISMEVSYKEGTEQEVRVGAATTSVVISPIPLMLTLIAVVAAALGTILKVGLDPALQGSFLSSTREALAGPPGITAAILSGMLVNVYEYTSLGESLKLGVTTNAALLIGVLSGVLSDRFLGALRGLLGG